MEIHIPDGSSFVDALLGANIAYTGSTDAVIPDADENKLTAALTAMARGEIEYVILSDDNRFLQAAGDARSDYILEYNDGSNRHQFRATNALTGTEIVDVFQKYFRRDALWHTLCKWERFNL